MKEIACFIIREGKLDTLEVVYKDDRPMQDLISSMDDKTKTASAVGTSLVFTMIENQDLPKGNFYDSTTEMLVALAGKTEEDLKSDLKQFILQVVHTLANNEHTRLAVLIQLGLTAENILLRNIITNTDFGLSETTIDVCLQAESFLSKLTKALGLDGEVDFEPIIIDGVELGLIGKFVEKPDENVDNIGSDEENDEKESS
jgi:hypothetical protein